MAIQNATIVQVQVLQEQCYILCELLQPIAQGDRKGSTLTASEIAAIAAKLTSAGAALTAVNAA